MTLNKLLQFVRLSRPMFLLGAALLYALGVGVARYLGFQIDWGIYLLGQMWGTMLQLSTHYLNEYFDTPADNENPNRTFFSGGSGQLGEGKLSRYIPLYAPFVSLTITASLTVVLLAQLQFSAPLTIILLGLIFFGAFFYSVPPVRLAGSGYGEITTAILVAGLVPALSFALQTGDLHRLLAMSSLPLVFIHIAMMLAFEIPDYGTDMMYEKRTMMVRGGWEFGMRVHNGSLLAAYLILGVALLIGMPFSIGGPALLTFPLALFQIWYMQRIASGIKPNWTLLQFVSVATFGLTAYLITFALWTV